MKKTLTSTPVLSHFRPVSHLSLAESLFFLLKSCFFLPFSPAETVFIFYSTLAIKKDKNKLYLNTNKQTFFAAKTKNENVL